MPTKQKTKKPVNAGYLTKDPSESHVEFANFITRTTGEEVSPATVGLVQRLYPLYLKSPDVAKAREAERAAKAAEKAQKDAAKAARLKARLDKIEAQREKLLAALDLDPLGEPEDEEPIRFAESAPEPEPEVEETEDEDDGEEESEEVTVEDDEDEWGSEDDDDEEDF